MNKNRASLLLSFIFILITSFSIERLFSNYRFSLSQLNLFDSLKIENQFIYLMGSTEFMNKGNTLNRNRLNLNMWNKNQFLRFKKSPRQIEAFLNIEDQANFYFVINRKQSPNLVVKFSEKNVELLEWFEGDEPIKVKELLGNISYPVHLSFKEGRLSLSQKQLWEEKNYTNIGLKGSLKGDIWLDQLIVNDSEISFVAPFNITHFFGTVALLCLLILLIPFVFLRTNVAIFVMILAVSVYFYDEYYAQTHYVLDFLVYDEETEDTELIKKESERVVKELSANKGKVLFIGSSQTYGEGASSVEKRWTNLFCVDKELDCLNIAIRSATTNTFNRLVNEIVSSAPQEIYYVLGHNDEDVDKHFDNIHFFIKNMKKHNIKITLVVEPNIYNLKEDDPLALNIINLSKRTQTFLVDPRNFLKANGWYWWDVVHLTDLGHYQFSKSF
ncbi:MAG: SGNH/GDSL hydrolase family protein [Oligoflexia bacterium]|nr:SGNH/GDSL hydrolase family protein [Oligoflexia bacterium]